MNKMKVAIIGAAGQVGSVLTKNLVRDNSIDVIAVCRNAISAGLIKAQSKECEIRIGSVHKENEVDGLIGDCDVVVNCALSMISGKPKTSRLVNKQLVKNICNANRVKTIIHLSSLSVYGSIINYKKLPKSTFENPKPQSDYGQSKLYIEKYALKQLDNKNINHYILRLGHVYGAKMDRSREMINLLKDPKFLLPFDGKLPSNAIHVETLGAMIIDLCKSPIQSGIYNVAEKESNWRDVFDWHADTLNLSKAKGLLGDRSDEILNDICDRSLLRDIFGWIKSLPIIGLIKMPNVFEGIFKVLYFIPESLTGKLSSYVKRLDVKKQINSAISSEFTTISALYYSDAMPGKYLDTSENNLNIHNKEVHRTELKNWYGQLYNYKCSEDIKIH